MAAASSDPTAEKGERRRGDSALYGAQGQENSPNSSRTRASGPHLGPQPALAPTRHGASDARPVRPGHP